MAILFVNNVLLSAMAIKAKKPAILNSHSHHIPLSAGRLMHFTIVEKSVTNSSGETINRSGPGGDWQYSDHTQHQWWKAGTPPRAVLTFEALLKTWGLGHQSSCPTEQLQQFKRKIKKKSFN